MNPDIDGKVELAALLDELSTRSPLAAYAPRGNGLFRYLEAGLSTEAKQGDAAGPYWQFTVDLFQRLSLWWHPATFRVLPTMTPWCIRDRSARYDQGPEMWGAPRADGYLRDDNSIIKKLPLPLYVDAAERSPYGGRRPWRGFTACHIWRDLPDGTVGGADPWVYSFMPNLVWIPTPLAPLTDHNPRVRALLQATSHELFRDVQGPETRRWTQYAWSKLAPGVTVLAGAPMLDLDTLALFRADDGFVARRVAYIDKFVDGVDEVLTHGRLSRKLICTRYTVGMPDLERDALAAFRNALAEYASGVRHASAVRPVAQDLIWPGTGTLMVSLDGMSAAHDRA